MQIKETTLHNLQRLSDALNEPYSPIIRDASIKRFEYAFAAIWRMLAKLLTEKHGKKITSPKECFREAFLAGLINEEQRDELLSMTDDRMKTDSEYYWDICDDVFGRLGRYAELMGVVVGMVETSN